MGDDRGLQRRGTVSRAGIGLCFGDVDKYLAAILNRIAKGTPSVTEVPLPDGRVIRVSEQPTAGGEWVATHEDFTEPRRAERILQRTESVLATVLENMGTGSRPDHVESRGCDPRTLQRFGAE
jgi:PAS fold